MAVMRITGGAFRSRELRAPRGARTRPTADRVREALFSMLQSRVELSGARVLDLYAGTGALAFEAMSRGAAHAVLVEKDRAALDALRENRRALGLDDTTQVLVASVEQCDVRGPFEVVFADPPYADVRSGVAGRALERVAARIASAYESKEDPSMVRAIWVVEHDSKDEAPVIIGLTWSDTRVYGDTALSFFEF